MAVIASATCPVPPRRRFLCRGLAWAWAPTAAGLLGVDAHAATGSAAAFAATRLDDALAALALPAAVDSDQVVLTAQDLVEDGASVEVELACNAPGVQRLILFVERNPQPLAADFMLTPAVRPGLRLRIKMAETSALILLALLDDGRVLRTTRRVAVTLGGCGDTEAPPAASQSAPQSQPTRIRAEVRGATTTVRMLMSHPMESGQRHDAAGVLVPAWHIAQCWVRRDGVTVLEGAFGPSVSRNPSLALTLSTASPGARVAVDWRDNRDARRHDETAVR